MEVNLNVVATSEIVNFLHHSNIMNISKFLYICWVNFSKTFVIFLLQKITQNKYDEDYKQYWYMADMYRLIIIR